MREPFGCRPRLERAGPPVDLSRHLERALAPILRAASLPALCDETARIFRELTGYDRVMVYRFDEQGHGEVVAEQRQPGLEPYLGNHYPASDIPQTARRLYERNRLRVLVDVTAKQVPLDPRLSPETGQDLDMSLCFLRSMSPIHVQYLQNMGVRATLVASLMVGGKLWGLVACHHYEPRFVHFELRAVCEVLAEAAATRIAGLESFAQAQAELSVRRLEQRMIEAITREGDWRAALFDSPRTLLQPLAASGAALLFEGTVVTAGDVPGTQQLREITAWLDDRALDDVFATAALGSEDLRFAPLASVASGLAAAKLTSSPGEYLLWFRPEQVRTVTWGGDPLKPVELGATQTELSPRRSFAKWYQLVEGTAEAWTLPEVTTIRMIADTVADVILQFRSVRMLIAQDQLDLVSRQMRTSDQPVVIANAAGHILLSSEGFERLLPPSHAPLASVEDLAVLFKDRAEMARRLREILRGRRTWRGEVTLKTAIGEQRHLLVRADPILSSPERVLGFVLLFTDLTDRRTADAARRRFQERIVETRRKLGVRLDTKSDLIYRSLLSSIIESAQVAALEITDSVVTSQMPAMLETIRSSVTRAAEILEGLIWHSSRTSGRD